MFPRVAAIVNFSIAHCNMSQQKEIAHLNEFAPFTSQSTPGFLLVSHDVG